LRGEGTTNRTPKPAIGLFVAALLMTIVNVGQSFVSVVYKVSRGDYLFDTTEIPEWLPLAAFIAGVAIVVLSVVGAYCKPVWYVLFVLLGAFSIAGAVLLWLVY
jgi:hypothetical protein